MSLVSDHHGLIPKNFVLKPFCTIFGCTMSAAILAKCMRINNGDFVLLSL